MKKQNKKFRSEEFTIVTFHKETIRDKAKDFFNEREFWESEALADIFDPKGKIQGKKTITEVLEDEAENFFDQYELEEKTEEEKQDAAAEAADAGVMIYNDELVYWYGQDCRRISLAEDARAEFGAREGIIEDLQQGQYLLLEEFYSYLISNN